MPKRDASTRTDLALKNKRPRVGLATSKGLRTPAGGAAALNDNKVERRERDHPGRQPLSYSNSDPVSVRINPARNEQVEKARIQPCPQPCAAVDGSEERNGERSSYISIPLDFTSLLIRHDVGDDEMESDDPFGLTEPPSASEYRQAYANSYRRRGSSVEPSTPEPDDFENNDEPTVDEPHHPTRKQKKQFRKRQITRPIRSAQRAQKQAEANTNTKACAQKFVENATVLPLPTCDSTTFPHVSTAWTGPKKEETASGLESVPPHFRLIRWDDSTNRSLLFVDNQGRAFAAMSAGPKSPSGTQVRRRDWNDVIKGCEAAIRKTRKACTFKNKDLDHKRGLFPALAIGVTRGPGSGVPTLRRASNVSNQAALNSLLGDPSMRAVASYQSHLLHLNSPNMGLYYQTTMNSAIGVNPKLRRNFPKSDFASLTVNFGPQTVCKKHIDSLNLAWGWCAITALGNYDYRKGGHLVLWDLGLVIEFPPGCTILIPSATLYHSNTPIAPDETRYSVTQYSGGEIFHWVHNGFQMAKDVDPPTAEESERIWKDGVDMYKRI